MSPTILRLGPYRFYFNSREETRMHVHIETGRGMAKFWLEPIVALATYEHLDTDELRAIELIIEERQDEFKTRWRQHFSQ
jgi:hypothetical protein